MPTPARQSRSTGGGGPGQAGAEPVGPPCPRHWAKLLRPALETVEGRALRAAPGLARAYRSDRRPRPLCVPVPPSRGCAHCGWVYYCASSSAGRAEAGRAPGHGSPAHPAAHKEKGRAAGRAVPGRHPIRRRGRVGGGAALPMACPVGVLLGDKAMW